MMILKNFISFKFLAKVSALVIVLFFVYNYGYTQCYKDEQIKTNKLEQAHAKKIQSIQNELYEVERAYLELEPKRQIVYKTKYIEAKDEVQTYTSNNNFSSCRIGESGMRKVNKVLRLQK